MATLIEKVDNTSPGSAGFAIETSSAKLIYFVTPDELTEAIQELLGSVKPARDSGGGLQRTLPRHHPQFPQLYASSVDVVGIGRNDNNGNVAGLVDADDGLDSEPAAAQYWEYAKYQLTVSFTQRPYAVLGDAAIPRVQYDYYTTSNTAANTVCAQEWLRFTDVTYEPSLDFGYAQQGQMLFRTGSGNTPGGYTFSGYPRIVIPKSSVGVYWYQVPESYLYSDNSKLSEFVGMVNQLSWYGWNPGELLYLGVKVTKRYTPPFPETISVEGGSAFDHSKILDLLIQFEETVRTQSDVPTAGAGNTNTTYANRSYIAAGHNLQPFLGGVNTAARGFYFAGSADDLKTPLFDSCNLAELFRDPDV